ncbi:hypothetical protein AACH06_26740 [Ideonella sp. DXS29W]|uniref:Uncharacterized protein n=1 Tax=Ideonella lacteola TaxID=2984193 RepID=A0ABU9C059_9BURK
MARVDARPGEFQLLRGSIDAKPGQLPEPIRFEFEFQKMQPSEQWRPTINLCVYAGNEEQVMCLQVMKTSELAQLVPRVLITVDKSSEVQKKETSFLLEAKSTHTLDVNFSKTVTSFRIDGRLVHEQPSSLVLDAYYFSCSSAVCGFNIYQPPGRH